MEYNHQEIETHTHPPITQSTNHTITQSHTYNKNISITVVWSNFKFREPDLCVFVGRRHCYRQQLMPFRQAHALYLNRPNQFVE